MLLGLPSTSSAPEPSGRAAATRTFWWLVLAVLLQWGAGGFAAWRSVDETERALVRIRSVGDEQAVTFGGQLVAAGDLREQLAQWRMFAVIVPSVLALWLLVAAVRARTTPRGAAALAIGGFVLAHVVHGCLDARQWTHGLFGEVVVLFALCRAALAAHSRRA